jgi:hypothetical protein
MVLIQIPIQSQPDFLSNFFLIFIFIFIAGSRWDGHVSSAIHPAAQISSSMGFSIAAHFKRLQLHDRISM